MPGAGFDNDRDDDDASDDADDERRLGLAALLGYALRESTLPAVATLRVPLAVGLLRRALGSAGVSTLVLAGGVPALLVSALLAKALGGKFVPGEWIAHDVSLTSALARANGTEYQRPRGQKHHVNDYVVYSCHP